MKNIICAFMLALALCTVSFAKEINSEFIYIRAGKMIDVEAGVILSDQLITLKDDLIVSVEAWGAKSRTLDGTFYDWSDYTVMPGMIDGHTHLIGDIQSNDVLAPVKVSRADDIHMGEVNALKTLMAGFTSVIDVGAYREFTDVELRDAINAGKVQGPRMWVSGAYITIPGGGGEVVGLGPDGKVSDLVTPDFRAGVAKGPQQVREKVRYLVKGGVDLIKMIATGAVLTVGTEPGEPEFNEAEIRAAVEEAGKYGKYVTAHAHGAEGIKMAVRAGVRSIQHGSIADDEALQMMKDAGTWLVADIYNGDYINEVGTRDGWPAETMRKNRETTETQRVAFRKAVKMGVNIAFGTDAGVYPHGDNGKQMTYMVKHGLSPMQAIQAATIRGAESMSLQTEIGSISPRKFADIIAVKGDVLADITLLEHVDIVMKGGKVVK